LWVAVEVVLVVITQLLLEVAVAVALMLAGQ
jgi:hypothetical protein